MPNEDKMKFGIRTPSLKKRLAARTSWKRMLRHKMGLKAPRGWGWLTNPKRAAYNKIYNRTSVSVDKLLTSGSKGRRYNKTNYPESKPNRTASYIVIFCLGAVLFNEYRTLFFVLATIGAAYYYLKRKKSHPEKSLQEARSTRLALLFGEEIGTRIENGVLWMGASKEMVFEMFGNPIAIENKYLTTKSRLIYKYFHIGSAKFLLEITIDDGLVTSWDDKR